MKNMVKLIGITALIAVIGFGMTACDDGNDNGGGGGGGQGVTVTFSIDKVDARTFTITQEGAPGWNSSIESTGSDARSYLFDFNASVTATAAGSGNDSTQYVSNAFDFTITSDTLLTIELRDYYSSVSGTIALNSGQGLVHVVGVDNNKTNTFIINPAKASITF